MKSTTKYVFLLLLFCTASTVNAAETWKTQPTCMQSIGKVTSFFELQKDVVSVEKAMTDTLHRLSNPAWKAAFCIAVSANLDAKDVSRGEGAAFSPEVIADTAIRYEAFRIQTFRDSAVSPKRFFGFLDEQGKSAAQEILLKSTAKEIAVLLNAYGSHHGMKTTVTPKEIIVTHLAEGGAKILTTDFANVETIDPVFGVGLDDFRIGFRYYPGLIEEVDGKFNSKLKELSETWPDSGHMSFVESILGTAVMYFYEKDLAEKMRVEQGLPGLETLPLDEQFVIASLVYNSGILFAPDRINMILSFSTADYLFDVSEKTAARAVNPRPRLPVQNGKANDALLEAGDIPPPQRTSWSAVYHILQRYGAWVALTKFSSYFDEAGNLKL